MALSAKQIDSLVSKTASGKLAPKVYGRRPRLVPPGDGALRLVVAPLHPRWCPPRHGAGGVSHFQRKATLSSH